MNAFFCRLCSAFLLLSLVCLPLAGCQSREERAAEQAAEALLDAVIACDSAAYSEIMGRNQLLPFTDIERFTLSRMTYDIVSCDLADETHAAVIADTHTFDLMMLLNQAMEKNGADAKEANLYVLNQLNHKTAPRASFRALIPLVFDGTQWKLNRDADTESLRDAVSGGAYSWYRLFEEHFGKETVPAA